MSEDINKVIIVGRLTRDAELSYTNSGYPLCKLSMASNRRNKHGDQWVDEANYFDVTLWGRRGEALNQYLTKGTQIAVEGQLKQDRWEQDGMKRNKVGIDAQSIQLLGGKREQQGGYNTPQQQAPHQGQNSNQRYTPPAGQPQGRYEDDIPF